MPQPPIGIRESAIRRLGEPSASFRVHRRSFNVFVPAFLQGPLFLGFFLGCAIAIPIGLLMGVSPFVRRAMEPITEFFRFIPAIAMIVFAIIWFGVGDTARIFLILNLVAACCRVLVEFLRIHPYVNGNGHIGRLMVWLLLWRYGYWAQRWPLDGHPPYDELLSKYRDGDRAGLEKFVLDAINGT